MIMHKPTNPQHIYGSHVANFIQPYLGLVLAGVKRLDSRLHATPKPPYGVLAAGDVLSIKDALGGIVAECEVLHVVCLELDVEGWATIERYKPAIMGTGEYWAGKAGANFATLIWLGSIRHYDAPELYDLPADQSWAAPPLACQPIRRW